MLTSTQLERAATMSTTTIIVKSDCRKFAPNIFNKNKCAACFKAKEEHSDEALENNRASRKVAKCGYLFAAPDWDFSNPINRTKRWQRRWFVLYDDGELTYSVDEHPETVPQAIIDMNRVVEVSEAEEVTGHPFSLALTAADRVHFLKGTSREESKWWFDILSMFPRTNMKTGRHKRNATFPGSKATTIISQPSSQHQQNQQPPPLQQSSTPNSPCMSKAGVSIQPFQTPPMSRPRFHSQTDSLMMNSNSGSGSRMSGGTTSTTTALNNTFNLLPVKDTNGRKNGSGSGSNNTNKMAIDEDDIIPVKEEPSTVTTTTAVTMTKTATTGQSPATTAVPNNALEKDIVIVDRDGDEKFKTRRIIRREIRGARSARCNSEILSSMLIQPPPPSNPSPTSNPAVSSAFDLGNSTSPLGVSKGYALVLPGSTLTAPIGSLKTNNDRPRSSLLLPPIPPPTPPSGTAANQQQQQPPQSPHSPFYLYMTDVPKSRHYESLESLQHSDRLYSPSRARHSSSKDTPDAASIMHLSGSGKDSPCVPVKDRPASLHELGTTGTALSRSSSSSSGSRVHTYDNSHPSGHHLLSSSRSVDTSTARSAPPEPGEAVRGDPDGCGLDPVTSFCSPLPDRRRSSGVSAGGGSSSSVLTAPVSPIPPSSASSSSNLGTSHLLDDGFKKGWLLRLSYGGEWKKYWFVLRSTGECQLSLYRDHAAEETGHMPDEVIDLANVTSVDETDTGRSYGFQVVETGNGDLVKRHSLAALTSGIRAQWIQALRNACNQAGKVHASSKTRGEMKTDKENVTLSSRNMLDTAERDGDESFESHDETASSGMEDDEDDDDDHDDEDDDDDGEEDEENDVGDHQSIGSNRARPDAVSLPPSPPVNRTAMSLVKERNRSRSSSRSRSRHRSGSPSSSSVRTLSPVQQQQQPTSASNNEATSAAATGQFQMRLDAAKGEITRLLHERREQERDAQKQIVQLNQRVADKEKQITALTALLEATKAENQRQINDIRNSLEAKEAELKALREESAAARAEGAELRESLKRERSEVYKLRDVAQELRSLLDSRNDTLNQLQSKTDEVESLNKRLKATQENLNRTQERLQRGIDENEGLFARLRQMEENHAAGGIGSGVMAGSSGDGSAFGSSMGLRRSRSSTGSMPLPLQLYSRNLLGGSSKKSLARLDSLSDLSNIDYDLDLDGIDRQSLVDEYVALRTRFERSLTEIRALKRELRTTQTALDGFEVTQLSLKQQWAAKESDYASQLNLMAARIEDLTAKMGSSDKQVRQLKVKVAKSESREKRRTQSLKGRESFQLSKDVEEKLVDLENKMAALGGGATGAAAASPASAGASPSTSVERESPPSRVRKGFEEPTKSFKMRRKSLEGGAAMAAAGNGANGGSATTDPVKILLRVDQLEQQVTGRTLSGGNQKRSSLPSVPERKTSLPARTTTQGRPPRSSPLKDKTTSGSTKRASVTSSPTSEPASPAPSVAKSAAAESPFTFNAKSSKLVQDLEQCVVELELIFNSRKVDGQSLIGKIRTIQQDLLTAASSGEGTASVSSGGGLAQVEKIQELLRVRLSELKVKRDHVRSLGKLDSAAVSQIAAEKLALELAIAEQISGGGQGAARGAAQDNLRDAHWTVQKLGWLRRKLSGEKSAPALEQSTSFGTYCAALAERLSAMAAVSSAVRGADGRASLAAVGDHPTVSLPAEVAQQLTEEEREMSVLFTQYKEEKLEELAALLAHETLRMGDLASCENNQLVEEVKVRQAWLEAQDIANKELVDSEVRQAMTRMAEVFAEDVAAEERLATALLLWPVQQIQYEQRCQVVEEVLRSEMEEAVLQLSNAYERSLKQMKANGNQNQQQPPEGDLEAVLSEFAEVVAHKALIDGHIAVLQGESPSAPLAVPSGFGSAGYGGWESTDSSLQQNVGVLQETESIIGSLSAGNRDAQESAFFFPAALNCAEVAAILHRNLVEPRGGRPDDNMSGPGSGGSNSSEDAIRQKYQDEIEQLRALTEKGMSALEGSHKRIIAQLEEKHQQDLARLQVEKERALAEETQATLAALDAMRKAHEAEVQREIARFKEEFMAQMASSSSSSSSSSSRTCAIHGGGGSCREGFCHSSEREQEIEDIRREILSLSEKYSHKCLETAALEQKVSSLSQQVSVSQRQISDLDARNQQLRAFLDAGQSSGQQQPDSATANPSDQLRTKDSQILMLQEDVAELQFCLRESQSREEELASLARNLGQYLRTDRTLRPDEVASLRHRLEDFLLLSSPHSRKNSTVSSVTDNDRMAPAPSAAGGSARDAAPNASDGATGSSRFHYARSSKDLTRSPSCPRLSAGFLSLAPRLSVVRPVASIRDQPPVNNNSSSNN